MAVTDCHSIGQGLNFNTEKYLGIIDEVAIFNVVLTENDIKNIMNNGLERATGITAISSTGKLAATWAAIKAR